MSETKKPRGEVADLSLALQNLCTGGKRSDKELRSAKKDIFKKVINYMTLGMDMSPLFPMMTSCANLSPDDLVLKKMLYLYLTHYSTQTPDLALLTINQLQKDSVDQDPTVRGLALRSLCSLRIPNFIEYVISPINSGLKDKQPYVRKTAVLGVLKLYHIDSETVQNQGLLEEVRRLLFSDSDPHVVANCLSVILEVEQSFKKLADKVLVYSLINKLKEFTDWGQCLVLELVSHYVPVSEEEVYDILNALEDRMSHVNSAVVMATVKVFLHLTINLTVAHQRVLERIKDPLKTLISRDDPATAFAVLHHVLLLAQRAPIVFENDYTSFYCRTHDPWYVKKLKIEILSTIGSSNNAYDIVSELTEYARDISPQLSREAIRAIGRITLAVPDASGLVERLLNFLESGSEHIVAETLIQMKDLLRRYPDTAAVCVGQLTDVSASSIQEPDARAAFTWILGRFGEHLPPAPYVLESLVEKFAEEDPTVQLALLTASVQLFFRRPPECQAFLGAALAGGLASGHQDVYDRALLYYRMLKADLSAAERVVLPPSVNVAWFADATASALRDRIFEEFNSLSVVLQKPAANFVSRGKFHEAGGEEREDALGGVANAVAATSETDLLGGLDSNDGAVDVDVPSISPPQPPPVATPPLATAVRASMTLLDFDLPAPVSPAISQVASNLPPPPSSVASFGNDLLSLGLAPLAITPVSAAAMPPIPSSSSSVSIGSGHSPLGMVSTSVPGANASTLSFSTIPSPASYSPSPMKSATAMNTSGGSPAPSPMLPDFFDLLGGGASTSTSKPSAPMNGLNSSNKPTFPINNITAVTAPAVQAPVASPMDFSFLENLTGATVAASPAPTTLPAVPELTLNPKARVSAPKFQELWRQLSVVFRYTEKLTSASLAAIPAHQHRDFTHHLLQAFIQTIASGGNAPMYKYYFYGEQMGNSSGPNSLILVECIVDVQTATLTATFKAERAEMVSQFVDLWKNCLAGFYR